MKSAAKSNKPSRTRTGVTLVLMFIWAFLISFTIISASEPQWLKKIAHVGRKDEAAGMKDYGDNFLRQKNYQMAIAQYQQALKIRPDYLEAMINLATTYYLIGNGQRGLKILQDALKLGSEYRGTLYFDMADIYDKQGDKDRAIEYFMKALETAFEKDRAYCRLGVIYLQKNQYEESRVSLEKALQIQTDPTTPYLRMLIDCLNRFQDDEENLLIVEQELKDGLSIEDLRDYDLETIDRVNESDPEIAKTHNFLGMVFANQGKIDEAIEQFERSNQIWPDNPNAKRNLQALRQTNGQAAFR
jgi:tetratricopeptide (TPR) repeat protein